MKTSIVVAFFAITGLSACSQGPQDSERYSNYSSAAPQNKFGFAEALEKPSLLPKFGRNNTPPPSRVTSIDIKEDSAPQGPPPSPTQIAVSIPKIAYQFSYGYRLKSERIPELQRKHADYCEAQGQQICRILNMQQEGSESEYGSGSLQLAVASPRARSFGAELSKITGQSDGKEISSSISGEDLSKQIVNTEARLRARTVLRDRLMEILSTRKGTVQELVEAERGVAQVNEEIDQARSWLAEMQGRVDFARVNIRYQSTLFSSPSPNRSGFLAPVQEALGNVGPILGTVIAWIITLLTIFLPIGLVVLVLRFLWRFFRKDKATPAPDSEPSSATEPQVSA
ncbi:MAG: DUF4349 domain-containing protein [Novosphingobium sp.]|nr:MAG: DUF4349 domain-containing protein [Novosphingobium sp.]